MLAIFGGYRLENRLYMRSSRVLGRVLERCTRDHMGGFLAIKFRQAPALHSTFAALFRPRHEVAAREEVAGQSKHWSSRFYGCSRGSSFRRDRDPIAELSSEPSCPETPHDDRVFTFALRAVRVAARSCARGFVHAASEVSIHSQLHRDRDGGAVWLSAVFTAR